MDFRIPLLEIAPRGLQLQEMMVYSFILLSFSLKVHSSNGRNGIDNLKIKIGRKHATEQLMDLFCLQLTESSLSKHTITATDKKNLRKYVSNLKEIVSITEQKANTLQAF